MTREHKLALILGFAVILIVGVLVGDHFSQARHVTLGTEVATPTKEAIGLIRDPAGVDSGNLPLIVPTSMAQQPAGTSADEPVAPTTQAAAPAEIKMGQKLAGHPAEPAVPGFVPAHGPGSQSLPPAARTDTVPSPMSSPSGLAADSNNTAPSASGLPTSEGRERRYVVEAGDSLYQIAQTSYGDGTLHKALAEYNKDKLSSPTAMRVGVTLRIPPKDVLLGEATLGPAARQDTAPLNLTPTPGPTLASREPAPSTPAASKTPAKPETKPEASAPRSYTVRSGDTLGSIARTQLGSSRRWNEILDLNRKTIGQAEDLKIGMVLKLPAR